MILIDTYNERKLVRFTEKLYTWDKVTFRWLRLIIMGILIESNSRRRDSHSEFVIFKMATIQTD